MSKKDIFGTVLIIAGYGLTIYRLYKLLSDEVDKKLEKIKDRVTTLEIGYATLRVGEHDDLK